MTSQTSLFDMLERFEPPTEVVVPFAHKPGSWPGCERYTYRGVGTNGRCWCCSLEDSEALCAWCVGHERWVEQEVETAARLMDEREARYKAKPYHTRLDRRSSRDRDLFGLVDTYGSAWSAIEAIVSNRDGLRIDFGAYVVHLLAWNIPNGCIPELWCGLMAQSDRLLATGVKSV